MDNQNTKPAIKVVLLGNSGAGKTSIAQRFVYNKFNHYSESTIGASFFTKHMTIIDDDGGGDDNENSSIGEKQKSEQDQSSSQTVKFHVWDTAGQEKYHSLAPLYYRGAKAAILVYDICNSPSFDALKSWLQRLKEFGPKGDNLIYVIVGNKCDLEDGRSVQREGAEEFAEREKCEYVEASARDDVNVDLIFQKIAKALALREKDTGENGKGGGGNSGLRLDDTGSEWSYSCGC